MLPMSLIPHIHIHSFIHTACGCAGGTRLPAGRGPWRGLRGIEDRRCERPVPRSQRQLRGNEAFGTNPTGSRFIRINLQASKLVNLHQRGTSLFVSSGINAELHSSFLPALIVRSQKFPPPRRERDGRGGIGTSHVSERLDQGNLEHGCWRRQARARQHRCWRHAPRESCDCRG